MQTLVISVPPPAIARSRARISSSPSWGLRAHPAGVDEDVQLARRSSHVCVGQDAQSLRAADRLERVRDGHDLDSVVGPLGRPRREHLPRPGEVQLLRSLEHRDPDPHGCSIAFRERCHPGGRDRVAALSADPDHEQAPAADLRPADGLVRDRGARPGRDHRADARHRRDARRRVLPAARQRPRARDRPAAVRVPGEARAGSPRRSGWPSGSSTATACA